VRCDLIIPALNEAGNVQALFDALDPLREDGTVRHVVVADNGSSDGTPEAAAARGAMVVTEPRRGYGAACLKAMARLDELDEPPEVIAFLDADLADDPAQLPALLAPLGAGEAEIVLGARARLAEPGALTPAQRFGNRLACTLIRLLTGRKYRDLGPFRAVRWSTLKSLDMADRTWGWTVEMQMKAALRQIPTVEIDVPYRPRTAGRSKISGQLRVAAAAGLKIIATVFSLWAARRRGQTARGDTPGASRGCRRRTGPGSRPRRARR
jgi:glycosyltransferase involved in cell wall biosynthesis